MNHPQKIIRLRNKFNIVLKELLKVKHISLIDVFSIEKHVASKMIFTHIIKIGNALFNIPNSYN